MCGRVAMLSFEEVLGVLECLRFHAPLNVMPDWPAVPRGCGVAGVGSQVNALAGQSAAELAVQELRWGFRPAWSDRPLFNTRVESIFAGSGTWEQAVRDGRCILPVAAFFEPHRTETRPSPRTGRPVKCQYAFGSADGAPLLLASVTNGVELSVVTTEPNASVEPVHHRMPLVLRAEEAEAWLASGPAGLEDRTGVELVARAQEAPKREQGAKGQQSLF